MISNSISQQAVLGREGKAFPAVEWVHRLEGNGIPSFPLTLGPWIQPQLTTSKLQGFTAPASSSKLTLHTHSFLSRHATRPCHLPLNTCLHLRFCISPQSPIKHQQDTSGSAPEGCPAPWNARGLEGKATWSRRVLHPVTTENKNLHLPHQCENFSAQS